MTSAPIVLIPARGGSKRLPRKNIRPFFGKPMMAWTIEAALESDVFGRVVVTTDDDETADIGRQFGAEVLRRPIEYSDDKSGLIDVLQHSAASLDGFPDKLCLPTANCPLRTAEDFRNSWEVFKDGKMSALLSMVEFGWTQPFRAMENKDTGIEYFYPEWMTQKGQAFPKAYCASGAVYWARTADILGKTTLYVPGIQGFPMPWHRGIDIDTLEDFRMAECLKFALDRGFDFEKGTP